MATKTVLIRVAEWSAWLPQEQDKASPLFLSDGVTGFEMGDDEKLLEVAVSSTGQRKHFPVEEWEGLEKKTVNKPHGLYVFQAVIAKEMPEGSDLPETPEPESKTAVVLPGQPSRAQRRANGGKKGQ